MLSADVPGSYRDDGIAKGVIFNLQLCATLLQVITSKVLWTMLPITMKSFDNSDAIINTILDTIQINPTYG